MAPTPETEPLSGPAALRGPVAVVAHDAGGAEILSSLIARGGFAPSCALRLVLAGPARAIFERKLGACERLTLDDALPGAGSVLTGTGWQAAFEFDARVAARRQGVPAVAFLDHWVNYRERFVRGGAECLPDALWVGDPHALALARRVLPACPAWLLPNPYFAEVREQLAARAARRPARAAGLRVLYVCEPVREAALRLHGDERHWGYTEEEALAAALAALPALGRPIVGVRVRPHPSEPAGKYDAQFAASAWPVHRGGGVPLLDEIAAADVVVGCNSMAMVMALLAGKRVLCAIPPGGAPCSLPLSGIEMLHASAMAVSA